MTHNNDSFSTSDIWLASFMKAKGMKIIRVDGDSRRAIFVFENTAHREEIIREFYNDGLVSITEIKNAMAGLKSAIFNMA